MLISSHFELADNSPPSSSMNLFEDDFYSLYDSIIFSPPLIDMPPPPLLLEPSRKRERDEEHMQAPQPEGSPSSANNKKSRSSDSEEDASTATTSAAMAGCGGGSQRRLWVKSRSRDWWDRVSHPSYPDADFRREFRMSRPTFDFLCDELGSAVAKEDTTLRAAIPVRQRVAVVETLDRKQLRRKMLEQLLIFTRGGLILWSCKALSNALKGSPIETLIKSCLLEERSAETSFSYDAPSIGGGGGAYTLKWTFHNDLGLVFVAVYQRILHLLYLDDLLAAVRREFAQMYDPKCTSYDEFDEIFRQLQREAEARADEMRKTNQLGKNPPVTGKKMGGGSQMNKKKNAKIGNDGNSKKNADGDGDENKVRLLVKGKENGKLSNAIPSVVKGKENGNPDAGAFDVNKLQKLRAKGGKKTDTNNTGGVVGVGVNKGGSNGEAKKILKKNRVWAEASSPRASSRSWLAVNSLMLPKQT